jgi:plastocyanin
MRWTSILFVAAVVFAACGGPGSGLTGTIGGGGGGGGGQNPLTAAVSVTSFAFAPGSVSIRPGGSVLWTWTAADTTTHNVSFANSALNSGNKRTGTHVVPFTVAGSYTYSCTLHGGMTGVVTVQ